MALSISRWLADLTRMPEPPPPGIETPPDIMPTDGYWPFKDGLREPAPKAAPTRMTAPPAEVAPEKLEALKALTRHPRSRKSERALLDLLRGANPAELDALVRGRGAHAILGAVDDRFFGPKNRSAALALLTKERLGDLSIESRYALVSALHQDLASSGDDRAVRDVFLGTRGTQLTALKNLVDAEGGSRDLVQLVFRDLGDAKARAAILAHFAQEAASLPRRELKILSDVEDTFGPGPRERRYPHGSPYPGVRQLYLELDRGPQGSGRPGDLVLLTPAPNDRFTLMEEGTLRGLERYGVKSTVVGADAGFDGSKEDAARGTLQSFARLQALYPEYGLVFIGDNGEGDLSAAAGMQGSRAALIHDVVGMPEAERQALQKQGIVVFDTFIDAARECYARGLISKQGLANIVQMAEAEVAALYFRNPEDKAQEIARHAAAKQRLAAVA